MLHRGDTTAAVWDMAFSLDSRWVSVCTARGTVHVFPVAPYGGKASVRTHLANRVVNKLTRYQRSAGVPQQDDLPPQLVNPAAQIRHSLANGGFRSLLNLGGQFGRVTVAKQYHVTQLQAIVIQDLAKEMECYYPWVSRRPGLVGLTTVR